MLTEDEFNQKNGKHCGHCNRNPLLQYKYEFICISCGFNLIKRKRELTKIQRRKINFINRLKYAEQKRFCICTEVYQLSQNNDYDKKYDVLSTLKIKKMKIKDILIEKYKIMLENPDIEQHYWSRTAIDVYKIGHDSIRLMELLIYYDRSYHDNLNYFDLMS